MPQPTRTPAALRHRHMTRVAGRVREVCRDSLTTNELIDNLLSPLDDALGVSGIILGGADPTTAVMSTATRVEGLPDEMAPPWMQNEAFENDFNKFIQVHRTATGAVTLHRSTQENPLLSSRYRLNRRMGFGPEMRVTFSSGPDCWGIASFVREVDDTDFDDIALRWIDDLRADIAEGLRRTMNHRLPEFQDHSPGVVIMNLEGEVTSMTNGARTLLNNLWMCSIEGLAETQVPGEVHMVATLARAQGLGVVPKNSARTRMRGRSGHWITMHGETMFNTDNEPTGVALVVEQSRPVDVLPIVLATYGLTQRERDVFAEMTSGQTAGEIAERLFISQHTVRDHFKSIFSKTGTTSRGELMSLLFQHRA